MSKSGPLSPKSIAVLSLIADGHSYGQIVDGHLEITYLDIFHAAEEALRLNENDSDCHARLAKIKARYPRAYEKWTIEEDDDLKGMIALGHSIDQAAERFQRQPSAIRSRLGKLGLGPPAGQN